MVGLRLLVLAVLYKPGKAFVLSWCYMVIVNSDGNSLMKGFGASFYALFYLVFCFGIAVKLGNLAHR